MNKHEVKTEDASRIRDWFAHRGGIAIWRSVNLSNPGASWTSPRLTVEGTPTLKPTWQAGGQPERIITDPSEVVVITSREVKRFHVAVRAGRQGLSLKLTDTSSARVRRAVEKAGEGAWHEFDYETQAAVIYVPGQTEPL